jgi:hypothetical protein
MASTETTPIQTYGGWRRSRGLGVGSLDTRQTVAMMLAVGGTTGVTAVFGMGAGLLALPFVVAVLAVCLWRRDGILLLDYASAALSYRLARSRGETSYRGHVLQEWPKAGDLPGLLASTELLDVEVPGRERCGLVWDRRTGLMSATMLLSTGGTLLSDPRTSEAYVASWGSMLAGFADHPAIRWAAVTVDIHPDAGPALRQDVTSRLDPSAPELARRVLGDLVEAAPAASARVSTRLTVTLDPSLGGERVTDLADGAAVAVRLLDLINPSSAGAEVLRRATAADIVRIVRTAYDPDCRVARNEDWAPEGGPLPWGAAGPVGCEEEPDFYRHENATSVSWALLEAPRQKVAHHVLLRLLSPGMHARRVTLLYRVLGREEAGTLLEKEQTAADARAAYRARTRRDENARERKDRTMAHGAAEEEAAGAGLVQFSMFVTATVADPADLPSARAEVEMAASACRLKLRVCRFGQSAAFAVGLPAGIYPPFANGRK